MKNVNIGARSYEYYCIVPSKHSPLQLCAFTWLFAFIVVFLCLDLIPVFSASLIFVKFWAKL